MSYPLPHEINFLQLAGSRNNGTFTPQQRKNNGIGCPIKKVKKTKKKEKKQKLKNRFFALLHLDPPQTGKKIPFPTPAYTRVGNLKKKKGPIPTPNEVADAQPLSSIIRTHPNLYKNFRPQEFHTEKPNHP